MLSFYHSTTKYLLIWVLISYSLPGFSQDKSPKEVIAQAGDLLKNNKFESAYNLLDQYDPYNKIPEIVLLKEKVALNGYITTINHQAFGFRDLKPGETVLQYRGKLNNAKLHPFKINKVLDSLMLKLPNNFELYRGRADFYYDVNMIYGDKWLLKQKKIFILIENDYRVTNDAGLGDFESNYRLGLIYVQDSNFQSCFQYFQKALALNPTNPDAHYNFAYACLSVGDTTDALSNALDAEKYYVDSSEKADAARMAGVVYGQMGKQSKAIEYMELSNKISPNNYNTLKILIDMYLKVDNKRKAFIATENFYDLGPQNPTIYNDLTDVYSSNDKSEALIKYFQSKLKGANGNDVQLGTLYFYIGRLYVGNNKDLALENLTKSAEVFSTVYKPENPVFKLIYDTMKTLK